MGFWNYFVNGLLFLAGSYTALWVCGYEVKKKLRYKFQCTICDFKASCSNLETLTMIKVGHQHNILRTLDKAEKDS